MSEGGYGADARQRVGFFTDTTVCIGCKACEVACKEWNGLPDNNGLSFSGHSYDNTGGLGANTWRHVAFIEQRLPRIREAGRAGLFAETDPGRPMVDGDVIDLGRIGTEGFADPRAAPGAHDMPGTAHAFDITQIGGGDVPGAGFPSGSAAGGDVRWLMSSDVCKHCTTAACLDVCPTGALFKTEFNTVVVQSDICNGCGYCVPACPYGVIDRREDDGRAWKCTMCYDRLKADQTPACAQACPTNSINFGPLDELELMARDRLDRVVAAGLPGAQLYGDGPSRGVDGAGSIFLLLDEPEVYGLPPDPVATTKDLPGMWRAAFAAAATLVALIGAVVAGGSKGRR